MGEKRRCSRRSFPVGSVIFAGAGHHDRACRLLRFGDPSMVVILSNGGDRCDLSPYPLEPVANLR